MDSAQAAFIQASWQRAKLVSSQFKGFCVPGKNFLRQPGSGETGALAQIKFPAPSQIAPDCTRPWSR
jgi:hypothetical protein